ncbi:hypothetical protein LNI90_03905 [Tenacibaculum dicentrarchi]|uniref:hypothetical protein n=1 Tax=Tenacibaculum dicentrarchi TaxID=669041 RepID=UPI000C4785D7|nr:hypothetical protein [Tenacibaculum dicentrarchi]MCD8407072.1 hypothetical protein [Tenacibaculum dicentrarchi]MCD8413951.1 hypothetical protein [Tenacibaculum dicentrarchi]MCD8419411.1 hypothetical protein [Tenacibaculum dicentrarchi]MCD8424427.1 hypothetical protein [Tenacibaculum dicentrarchi]
MKQQFILSLLVISSFIAKAQTSNIITLVELNSFKINNITLSDLKKTAGKQAAVETLLGSANSYKSDENQQYYYFVFKGLKVDFSRDKSTPYIESFEINNNESSLTIKQQTITIGDNISKLGTIFFSPGRNGDKSIIYTSCEDCDSFINIEFNQNTNLITKISYLDMS